MVLVIEFILVGSFSFINLFNYGKFNPYRLVIVELKPQPNEQTKNKFKLEIPTLWAPALHKFSDQPRGNLRHSTLRDIQGIHKRMVRFPFIHH